MAKVVRFHEAGGPEVLRIEDLPSREPGRAEVRLRVEAIGAPSSSRTSKEALEFVDQIGALAEAEGHHPGIRFGWGYCTVELHTHKIKNLHKNDFIMAAKINELAWA